MSSFTAIDLAKLPSPAIVEELDHSGIIAAMIVDLIGRDPSFSALLESDPAIKVLEVAAYRELLLRARVNDAARATMLASATGADLDNLAANVNVARLLLYPGDSTVYPPAIAVYESDADLRRRAQMAFEGLSVAGSEGAYVFHALSADARVKSAVPEMTAPGSVRVSVLSREGDGTAVADLLAAVDAALNAETVRPLTDFVSVVTAEVQRYGIAAAVTVYPGPDAEVVRAAAEAAVRAKASELHALGYDVPRSALIAALHVAGVQRVELASPAVDIACAAHQVAFAEAVVVTLAGVDE